MSHVSHREKAGAGLPQQAQPMCGLGPRLTPSEEPRGLMVHRPPNQRRCPQREPLFCERGAQPNGSGARAQGAGGVRGLASRQVVQRLTRMVGRNVKVYDMVLQFLRTLFLRTRNVHYCTLRAELLMSLHDLDVGDICSVDPCHKVGPCSAVVLPARCPAAPALSGAQCRTPDPEPTPAALLSPGSVSPAPEPSW